MKLKTIDDFLQTQVADTAELPSGAIILARRQQCRKNNGEPSIKINYIGRTS